MGSVEPGDVSVRGSAGVDRRGCVRRAEPFAGHDQSTGASAPDGVEGGERRRWDLEAEEGAVHLLPLLDEDGAHLGVHRPVEDGGAEGWDEAEDHRHLLHLPLGEAPAVGRRGEAQPAGVGERGDLAAAPGEPGAPQGSLGRAINLEEEVKRAEASQRRAEQARL